ncbi:MAG: MopE-related protein [Pseudomonadota bacterium]
MRALLATLLLAGCPAPEPVDTGPRDWDADHALWPEDCAPHDAAIHPAAAEACDGLDNDCDGEIDEDFPDSRTWHRDADGDGFGDPQATEVGCEGGDGLVDDATDCDDRDPDSYPGAPEIWYDGVDQDCAGDDDTDADGDGWSWDGAGGDDCDDTDPGVHPGLLDWTDGVDRDCDGEIDASLASAHGAGALGPSAGARLGAAGVTAGDQDGDGVPDLLLGSPGHGIAWLAAGGAESAAALPTGALARLDGDPTGQAGAAVAAVDLDGDGVLDLAVGAWLAGGPGAVHLLLGPTLGDLDLNAADATIAGLQDGDAFGYALAGPSDSDGDGLGELLIGARDVSTVAPHAGAAWLLPGPAALAGDLGAASAVFEGTAARDFAGATVAAPGDVDGDGLDDVLIGARGETSGGGAYLWLGPVAGTQALDQADARWPGLSRFDATSWGLAGAGDTDGDGYRDLLVGACGSDNDHSNAGVAWLIRGRGAAAWASAPDLEDAEASFEGESTDAQAGWALASPGDVDGDGRDDVLVGAPGAQDDAGLVALFLAPRDGVHLLSAADLHLRGDAGDRLGEALAPAGDQDGDRLPDLWLGAQEHGDAAQGAAWVLGGAP